MRRQFFFIEEFQLINIKGRREIENPHQNNSSNFYRQEKLRNSKIGRGNFKKNRLSAEPLVIPCNYLLITVVVLAYVHKLFDIPSFRRWGLIALPLSVSYTYLLLKDRK